MAAKPSASKVCTSCIKPGRVIKPGRRNSPRVDLRPQAPAADADALRLRPVVRLRGWGLNEDSVREVETVVRANEDWRLRHTIINLIASENVLSARAARCCPRLPHTATPRAIRTRQAVYQGTKNIDIVESKTRDAMKKLFGVSHAEVRTVSGTNANDVVFSAFVKPEDRSSSIPRGRATSATSPSGHGRTRATSSAGHDPKNGYAIGRRLQNMLARRAQDGRHREESSCPRPAKNRRRLQRSSASRVFDGAHVLGLTPQAVPGSVAEGCDICSARPTRRSSPQRGIHCSRTSPTTSGSGSTSSPSRAACRTTTSSRCRRPGRHLR